jgi:hypothetical protein
VAELHDELSRQEQRSWRGLKHFFPDFSMQDPTRKFNSALLVRCLYISFIKFSSHSKRLRRSTRWALWNILREYSTGSQTTKLLIEMVARGGIEPPTRGFSVRCSTN